MYKNTLKDMEAVVWKIIFSWVWDYCRDLFAILCKEGAKELAEICEEAIKDMSVTDVGNDEKRRVVLSRLAAAATRHGWHFTESMIEAIFAVGFRKWKSTQGGV